MSVALGCESPVLVDANVIIEAHRTRTWRALSSGLRVETVEACVAETQTGFQRRRKEEAIDLAELRSSLAAVHSVSVRERAELALRKGASPWTKERTRSGCMRSGATTHGCCAARTRRVCDAAFGLATGRDSCRLRNCSSA